MVLFFLIFIEFILILIPGGGGGGGQRNTQPQPPNDLPGSSKGHNGGGIIYFHTLQTFKSTAPTLMSNFESDGQTLDSVYPVVAIGNGGGGGMFDFSFQTFFLILSIRRSRRNYSVMWKCL